MVPACRFSSIDVSVAVATEGGLITPIVTGADVKSVTEIGKAMKDLAGVVLPKPCTLRAACIVAAASLVTVTVL